MAQRLKFIRTLASSSSSSRSKVRPKQKKKPSSSSSSSTDQYEKLFRELEQARNQEFQHKSIIPQESRLWSNTFGFESSYQAAGQQILEGILERFNDPESAVDVVYEQVRASDLDEEQLKMLKKVSKLSDEQIQKAIEREKNMDEEEFDAQLSDLEEYAELDDKARDLAFRRMCSIAIVGTPNSGKSTLLNTLVKNHVAAVSSKANTTNAAITGIYNEEDVQLVFVDTPGILSHIDHSKMKNKTLVRDSWDSLQKTDVALLVVDASKRLSPHDYFLLKDLSVMDRPENFKLCLVLNKVDRVEPKKLLLPLAEKLDSVCSFDEVFMVSAAEDDGVNDIRDYLMHDCSIRRPWIYDENEVCDMSQSERVAEIIREKVFQRLNQEIPYQISQSLFDWRKGADGKVYIEQLLQVDNQRHKMMLIGKSGQVLKGIQARAERDIQEILGSPVKLKISVAVRRHENEDGGLFSSSYDI